MEEKEIKFVRLRNTMEDLVGYVTHYDEYIVIERPLIIDIETYMEDNKQILSLQEYLPQAVINIQEIEIPTDDIAFTTSVKEEFIEQYEYISNFFYDVEKRGKSSVIKNKEEIKESVTDTAQKVVSILEALQSKKDKPIH